MTTSTNLIKKSKNINQLLYVSIFCFSLIIIFIMARLEIIAKLENNLVINTALFCSGTAICIKLIRKLPRRGDDVFEPGLLLVIFITMGLAPVAITTAMGVPITQFQRGFLNKILSKVILLHLILMISFSLCYYLINFRISINVNNRSSFIWFTNSWFWSAIALTIITFGIEYALGILHTRATGDSNIISLSFFQQTGLLEQQVLLHLRRFRGYAIIFAVGAFACRAPTLRRAKIRLIGIVGVLGTIYFGIFASRGFLFSTVLAAACYADMVRWKGKLFNLKNFLLLVLFGVVLLQFLNLAEAYLIYGNSPDLYTFTKMFVMDYGIAENSAVIIDWVDTGATALQKGKNYITALLALLPTQIRGRIMFLPYWYSSELSSDQAAEGVGFGFSAVAEGYLNGGYIGVFIHGIVLAILTSIIRFFKFTKRMSLLRPFLFAGTISLSYTLFREDTVGMLSRLRNSVIDIILLVFVMILLVNASKKRVDNNYQTLK